MYVTVRTVSDGFYVNIVKDDGYVVTFGNHNYSHKRSARRAAIALASKTGSAYRQDLEYGGDNEPVSIEATTAV